MKLCLYVAGLVGILFVESSVVWAQQKNLEERKKANEIYINLQDEPPSLDPSKQGDQVSHAWLNHIYEGLMTYDVKSNMVLGTAEKYERSADGKKYTFKIRKNAKWHDGKAVSAKDYEYAFKRLVDPNYASQYAFFAETAAIVNAKDIIGKKKKPEELGVKAIDDHTFEVSLEKPAPYFLSMTTYQVFFPIRKDLIDKFGDKFASSKESVIGNGPFKMVAWNREQSLRLEKADTYWNAASIKLNAIENPAIVKDAQSFFNNFTTGGIDVAFTLQSEIIKQAQDKKLQVRTYPEGCVEYLELNTRPGKVFSDIRIRKAVRDGISRQEYVNKIVAIPGYKAIAALFPDYLPGSKPTVTYRKEVPFNFKDNNIKEAKKLVAEYLKEKGIAKVPTFTIISNDDTRRKKYSEYYQSQLSKLFDSEVKIENLPFKTRLQRMRDGQFDMVIAGWCPDYNDLMTFGDLLTSVNENNHTGWKNAKLDELISQASGELDSVKRVKLFAEAEKIIYDESPLIVLSQTGGAFVSSKGLEGVVRGIFTGFIDVRHAFWKK